MAAISAVAPFFPRLHGLLAILELQTLGIGEPDLGGLAPSSLNVHDFFVVLSLATALWMVLIRRRLLL